jgi:hypothetical protein
VVGAVGEHTAVLEGNFLAAVPNNVVPAVVDACRVPGANFAWHNVRRGSRQRASWIEDLGCVFVSHKIGQLAKKLTIARM